jgi:hypothetical protein
MAPLTRLGRQPARSARLSNPWGLSAVGDTFAGDAFYFLRQRSASATVFAFLSQGSFILGDQSAQLGAHATFWGAQWASRNTLSGGPAPATFKSFADSLSAEPPNCGVVWTTQPGNSSDPPASVPAYMGVLARVAIGRAIGSDVVGHRQPDRHRGDRPWVLGRSGTCGNRNDNRAVLPLEGFAEYNEFGGRPLDRSRQLPFGLNAFLGVWNQYGP